MPSIILLAYEQTKMTQGYFYTLSAIAQAFAAIVALNAVFVIYKFQLLRNRSKELIMELRKLLLQIQKRSPGQMEMITDKEVLSLSRGITGGVVSNILNGFKETLKSFDQNKSISENITKWLKITLKFNVLTIIFSLAFLPWGGLIPDLMKYVILGLILLSAIFSLLVTVNAILITLESGKLSFISKIFKE